jgi:hypothetical protein
MNPLKRIKGKYLAWISQRSKLKLISSPTIETVDPDHFPDSLSDPNDYYLRAFQDFHSRLPEELRSHRAYYSIDRRGFGEDAFHTMWWRLIRKYRPTSFLEIGVYRGQVVSLIALLSKIEGITCEITGISPFNSSGDSVSEYRRDLDYLTDTLRHIRHFGLTAPELINAYSTDAVALEVIAARQWDMIYIDGNHDYDIVVKDWAACSKAIKPGGIIVLDDAGLSSSYHPPAFATGGHPGPSQLASEIDPRDFEEILQVGHNRAFRRLT